MATLVDDSTETILSIYNKALRAIRTLVGIVAIPADPKILSINAFDLSGFAGLRPVGCQNQAWRSDLRIRQPQVRTR